MEFNDSRIDIALDFEENKFETVPGKKFFLAFFHLKIYD